MKNLIFIEEPTVCPCCSYKLEKINDQIFCRNTSCSAKVLKKIEHFAKVLKIKGLGPKTIEKLNLQDIVEIFNLDYEETIAIIGKTLTDKLFNEIEKAKEASLSAVIESFSIPLVGSTVAEKLATVIDQLEDIGELSCKTAGLGTKVTANLLNWKDTEYLEIKDFLPFNFRQKELKNISNMKKVCITGKLKSFKTKADAAASLAAAGYQLVESVTKDIEFLIDETDSMSSKREKAVKYGIKIITDLNDLIERKLINE